jgi:hypothetical protein
MSLPPKMSRKQAKILWNSLTPAQKLQFNQMLEDMQKGKLMLTKVNVDDNEKLQSIILDHKDKPGAPSIPFGKHFNLDD